MALAGSIHPAKLKCQHTPPPPMAPAHLTCRGKDRRPLNLAFSELGSLPSLLNNHVMTSINSPSKAITLRKEQRLLGAIFSPFGANTLLLHLHPGHSPPFEGKSYRSVFLLVFLQQPLHCQQLAHPFPQMGWEPGGAGDTCTTLSSGSLGGDI